jgi:hypothetical protein
VRYWQDKVQAELSRSRPYHKNDNCFVEENNSSLVRAYVGYARLDSRAQVRLLNQLYDQLWLYHNFFQPVMRLSEKLWQEHRVKRVYDDALPPFDRLCKTGVLSPARRLELETLRRNIQNLIDQLYALPVLKEGVVEDVRLSLFDPQAVLV